MSSHIRMAIKFAAAMNMFSYLYLSLEPQHMSLYLQGVIAVLFPIYVFLKQFSAIIFFCAFVKIPVQIWFKHSGLTARTPPNPQSLMGFVNKHRPENEMKL